MRYLRWFGRALRPHWMAVTCMMFCHVLLAVCSVAFVFVSKKLVDVAVAILGGRADSSALSLWAVALASVILVRVLLNALRTFLRNFIKYIFKILVNAKSNTANAIFPTRYTATTITVIEIFSFLNIFIPKSSDVTKKQPVTETLNVMNFIIVPKIRDFKRSIKSFTVG